MSRDVDFAWQWQRNQSVLFGGLNRVHELAALLGVSFGSSFTICTASILLLTTTPVISKLSSHAMFEDEEELPTSLDDVTSELSQSGEHLKGIMQELGELEDTSRKIGHETTDVLLKVGDMVNELRSITSIILFLLLVSGIGIVGILGTLRHWF